MDKEKGYSVAWQQVDIPYIKEKDPLLSNNSGLNLMIIVHMATGIKKERERMDMMWMDEEEWWRWRVWLMSVRVYRCTAKGEKRKDMIFLLTSYSFFLTFFSFVFHVFSVITL